MVVLQNCRGNFSTCTGASELNLGMCFPRPLGSLSTSRSRTSRFLRQDRAQSAKRPQRRPTEARNPRASNVDDLLPSCCRARPRHQPMRSGASGKGPVAPVARLKRQEERGERARINARGTLQAVQAVLRTNKTPDRGTPRARTKARYSTSPPAKRTVEPDGRPTLALSSDSSL